MAKTSSANFGDVYLGIHGIRSPEVDTKNRYQSILPVHVETLGVIINSK